MVVEFVHGQSCDMHIYNQFQSGGGLEFLLWLSIYFVAVSWQPVKEIIIILYLNVTVEK